MEWVWEPIWIHNYEIYVNSYLHRVWIWIHMSVWYELIPQTRYDMNSNLRSIWIQMSVRYEFISMINISLTYRKIDNHNGKIEYWESSLTWHDIRWEILEPFLQCGQWVLTCHSKSSIPSNHLQNIEHNVDISYYQNSDYKCANTLSKWYPWLTALKRVM